VADISSYLTNFFTLERVLDLAKAVMILAVASLAARLAGNTARKLVAHRGDPQQAQLLARLTSWGLFGLGVAWALQELGFQLSVLLGAAGVLTVAVGFASQTTLSNLISGFFLFGERPFRLGDWIEVEGVSGEVLAVDLMATKLRTAENHFVRIPNELMIKTKVRNHTRFPIRRLDLKLPIAAFEDLGKVRGVLFELSGSNALCLDEPAPIFLVSEFGDGKVVVQFSVWVQTENHARLQSALTVAVQNAFREHEIRIPGLPAVPS
jgi:small-conductance mechanosensitive channel